LLAGFRIDIKEESFHWTPVLASNVEVGPAFLGREVSRIDISHGLAEGNPVTEQVPESGEDAAVDVLVGDVSGEEFAQVIRRKCGEAAPGKP
jgi:hypothetical protein